MDELMESFYEKSEHAEVYFDSVEYYMKNLEPWHARKAIDSAIMLYPFEAEYYGYRATTHLLMKN